MQNCRHSSDENEINLPVNERRNDLSRSMAIVFLLVPQSYPGALEFLHHLGSAQILLNALFKSQLKIFAQQCPINIGIKA